MNILSLIMMLVIPFFMSGCLVHEQPAPPSLGEQQNAIGLIDRGTAYLRSGDFDLAKAAFEVSYQLKPSAEALDGLGSVAFVKGDFITARDYFLDAYYHDETYAESLAHLGILYDFLGFHDEAQQLYIRSVSLQPDNPASRNNYGALLYQRRQSDAARREFHKAYVILPHEIIDKNLKKAQNNTNKRIIK